VTGRVHVVSITGLLADVIAALQSGRSINDLLEHELSPFHGG
jgi:hypothetical protein